MNSCFKRPIPQTRLPVAGRVVLILIDAAAFKLRSITITPIPRLAFFLPLAAALALAACDEEVAEVPFLPETATPVATPTVEPTPAAETIGSYDDPNDFRSFGLQLANAIAGGDVQFFLDNAAFEDVSCEVMGIPGPPESCAGQPPTTTMPAILVGVLQSEGFYEDTAGYEQLIREFLTTFDASASDAYGSPEPHLYAYGRFATRFAAEGEPVQAIATRIAPGERGQFPPPGRGILVFRTAFDFDGQRWAIAGLLIGGDPISLAQFLDPTGETAAEAAPEPLFQFWARWTGATP